MLDQKKPVSFLVCSLHCQHQPHHLILEQEELQLRRRRRPIILPLWQNFMIQEKDQQISDLQAKLKDLQRKSFHSVAVQASYLAVASDFLRGVETCGEHTMEVVGDYLPQKLTWPSYGFNIEVPDGALSRGVTACIAVKAILTGQFKFPENYQQISALYWISCSEVFLKHIAVNIQHCAHIATEEECTTNFSFIVAKCSQEYLPYTFITRDGVFNPHTQYATVKLKRFSIVGAVATEDTKKFYVALKFYKQILNTRDMSFQFAVLPAIDAFIEKFHADRKQKGWTEDDDDHQIIEFKDSSITLDVPSEPCDNWRIIPRSHPQIYKSEVDQPKGKFHPCCTLEIQWVGGGQPVTKLFYKVHLEGAQTPRDYFTISLYPKDLAVTRETNAKTQRSGEDKELRSTSESMSVVQLVDAVRDVNNWHDLGLHLDIKVTKLGEIGKAYNGLGRIKAEMFEEWLKSCLDASWHKLVTALNAIGEKRVAGEVESCYCKQSPESCATGTSTSSVTISGAVTGHLDCSSMRRVFDFLTQYSDWESLGLKLGLDFHTLEAIKASNPEGKQACKRKMLEYWLSGKDHVITCGGPTWQQLADCLKILGEDTLAQNIKSYYCQD